MSRSARALVVGINDYPDAPLRGCVADARLIGDLLERNEDGSPNFDVRYLTSGEVDVDRDTLLQAIDELLAQPADVALLHFSGHGIRTAVGSHLVTMDATQGTPGVLSHELMTKIDQSPVGEIVVLIDCCDSGAFSAPPDSTGMSVLREGTTLLTASGADEYAVETAGGGVFTAGVAEALSGGAADVVGRVTVASVYAYCDEALGPWDQRPHLKANLRQLTELRTSHAAIDLSILRELTTWFPDLDHEYRLDPSYEPEAAPQDDEHEGIFTRMQKCRAAHLIEPVGEEHMYWAAMRNRACRLTPLGRRYWRQVRDGRL